MTAGWRDLDATLRRELTAAVESQPELLLEHNGGPEGLKADLILATLYGLDEQVDAEWRLSSVVPYLRRPIRPRLTASAFDEPPSMGPPPARYDLQSNWATAKLDFLAHASMLPADVRPAPQTNVVTVALVRYRRVGSVTP
jgi:hypothetical protein